MQRRPTKFESENQSTCSVPTLLTQSDRLMWRVLREEEKMLQTRLNLPEAPAFIQVKVTTAVTSFARATYPASVSVCDTRQHLHSTRINAAKRKAPHVRQFKTTAEVRRRTSQVAAEHNMKRQLDLVSARWTPPSSLASDQSVTPPHLGTSQYFSGTMVFVFRHRAKQVGFVDMNNSIL